MVLSYDEMQIKSHLVYKKSTGLMIGFTEMCDINEEMRIFQDHVEECCKEKSSLGEMKRDFATRIIFYMVSSISNPYLTCLEPALQISRPLPYLLFPEGART